MFGMLASFGVEPMLVEPCPLACDGQKVGTDDRSSLVKIDVS